MASVVFLRGVNVGGHKAFAPSALAKKLAHLDVINIGAAGTFVVRKNIGEKALRAELQKHMTFDADMMICKARDVLDLSASDPFAEEEDGDVKRYVSVLAKKPSKSPALPILKPEKEWQVKVFAVTGRFALSLHRRMGRTLVYPNEVVEKKLGVSATTRNWNTIEAICRALKT